MASIMSSTIINVAVPDMSRHFSLGQERAQWVAFGLHGGHDGFHADHAVAAGAIGYRCTYAGCMLMLMAGGIVGGFATDFSLVLAGRVAEGLAAGVVQPIPAIIILRAFEPHEQGRASGIFGMGVVLATCDGPEHWRCAGRPLWMAFHFFYGGSVLSGLAVDGLPLCAGDSPGPALPLLVMARDWTGPACCWPALARCAC